MPLPFNERILSAYILFASWGEKAPREAFEHANTKMGRTGMFVRPTILQSWASTDPNAAAQYYESHKSQFAMMGMMGRMGGGRGASSGADTVAGEWAKQDPDAALAWAGTLEGPDREDATKKVISQIASTDPQRAAALTSELSGAALSDVNTSIAAEWAKKDWSAAEGFISSLPADQQASALGAAVESLVAEQPDLAATKVLEIPEGAARDRAVRSLAKSMASEDPAAAVDWILANGSSDVQAEAVSDIMGNWVSVDASAAKDFATAQAEGPLRDSAVASYVLSDMEGDPVDHIELALSIGDDRARRRAIGATAMRWMSEDAEGATEYLSNSPGIDQKVVDWILNQRR